MDRRIVSLEEGFLMESIFNSKKDKLHYVGKTKGLLRCETLLNKIVDPKIGNDISKAYFDMVNSGKLSKRNGEKVSNEIADSYKRSASTKINASKELKEVEKILCKEFGFKELYINVLPIKQTQAMTIFPSFLIRDIQGGMPNYLTSDNKERYYDYSHENVCLVTVFIEFFNGKFTGGEILAVILHEIGHNFDVSLLSYINDIVAIPFTLLMGKPELKEKPIQFLIGYFGGKTLFPRLGGLINKFINEIEDILELKPLLVIYNIYLEYTSFISKFLDTFKIYDNIQRFIYSLHMFRNPLYLANSLGSVQQEVFSDSFATVHGYGPELISSFNKLTEVLRITKTKSVFLDTWTWAGATAGLLIQCISNHPEDQTRARLILDDMKKLSENETFPPKVKAMIKKDYELTKKAYDNYIEVDPDHKKAIAERFTRYFKEKILFGKMDLRTYFTLNSAICGTGLKK